MPPTLQLIRPEDGDRKLLRIVLVRVAVTAAVEEQAVVEQRAIAVGRRLQLLQEVRQRRRVMRVDLGQQRDLLRRIPMMRQPMMPFGDADFRIRAATQLLRQHEGADPRQIGLVGEHLQVQHQLRVLEERRGHRGGLLHEGQFARALGFGGLEPELDVANGLQVVVEADAIGGPDALLRARAFPSTESRMLRFSRKRFTRAAESVVPMSPNRSSNTARGLSSIGSGIVGPRQQSVLVYTQL